MADLPDPKKLAARTIELLGGPRQASEIFNAEFGAMINRWDQNTALIGRILRAHLYVEHYMAEYLQKANPRLGSLDGTRLSYAQKVKLLDRNDPHIQHMIAGIKHLNTVRNRIAHNLDVQVTKEDAAVFLAAVPMNELRAALDGHETTIPEPVEALEGFATYAAHELSQQFSRFGAAFTQALSECK